MRDLFIFVREMLLSDPELKRLFLKAGFDAVDVIQPEQRTGAKYPRLILDTEEGTPEGFGESAAPKIFNGRLRFDIVAATDEEREVTPITMRKDLSERCRDIVLGSGDKTMPLKGQRFIGDSGKRWCVTMCSFVKERALPAIDPLFSRGELVFSIQLCHNS